MDIIQERLHIFDTVRQYLYDQAHQGTEIPEWLDLEGFEKSRREALKLNQLGLLGEFYNRIMKGTL